MGLTHWQDTAKIVDLVAGDLWPGDPVATVQITASEPLSDVAVMNPMNIMNIMNIMRVFERSDGIYSDWVKVCVPLNIK